MDATRKNAVKVLNRLIETTLDSAHGYREAAESAQQSQLKSMFGERSRRRLDLARQLQQEVRTFGGEPRDEQSMLGKAHNRFVDLRSAILGGHGEKAVIDEVERSDDVIKSRFERAIEDDDLPADSRRAVTRAYESICADHDEIRRLKHAIQ